MNDCYCINFSTVDLAIAIEGLQYAAAKFNKLTASDIGQDESAGTYSALRGVAQMLTRIAGDMQEQAVRQDRIEALIV